MPQEQPDPAAPAAPPPSQLNLEGDEEPVIKARKGSAIWEAKERILACHASLFGGNGTVSAVTTQAVLRCLGKKWGITERECLDSLLAAKEAPGLQWWRDTGNTTSLQVFAKPERVRAWAQLGRAIRERAEHKEAVVEERETALVEAVSATPEERERVASRIQRRVAELQAQADARPARESKGGDDA